MPSPIGAAGNLQKIEEFWKALFDDEIVRIIVDCTNQQIENHCADLIAQDKEIQSYHCHTDMNEINAFIALLYYSAMWKTHRVDEKKLWTHDNGTSFYRCVMSCRRFQFLSVCLRFDIKATRDVNDRFAPIRNIWSIFIENCKNNYKPSSQCTVDEQLHGFRGRCKMRVYMKSKPDKYGLMFKTLNDAATAYLVIILFYLKFSFLIFIAMNHYFYL